MHTTYLIGVSDPIVQVRHGVEVEALHVLGHDVLR